MFHFKITYTNGEAKATHSHSQFFSSYNKALDNALLDIISNWNTHMKTGQKIFTLKCGTIVQVN